MAICFKCGKPLRSSVCSCGFSLTFNGVYTFTPPTKEEQDELTKLAKPRPTSKPESKPVLTPSSRTSSLSGRMPVPNGVPEVNLTNREEINAEVMAAATKMEEAAQAVTRRSETVSTEQIPRSVPQNNTQNGSEDDAQTSVSPTYEITDELRRFGDEVLGGYQGICNQHHNSITNKRK